MRKLMLAAVACLALATAGLALAKGHQGAGATAVTGSFTATTVSASQTRSCTTSDGKTLQTTHAVYTGTASGDATLTGALTIDARSAINTSTDVGVVTGRLRITTSAGDTQAHFTGVYDHGTVAGLTVGHVQGPHGLLLANTSATFSPTAGFSNGKLGGSAGGSAVEGGAGWCEPAPLPPSGDHGKHKGHGR